jgi:hypothetical protein
MVEHLRKPGIVCRKDARPFVNFGSLLRAGLGTDCGADLG